MMWQDNPKAKKRTAELPTPLPLSRDLDTNYQCSNSHYQSHNNRLIFMMIILIPERRPGSYLAQGIRSHHDTVVDFRSPPVSVEQYDSVNYGN